jgi:hypothetical protein
VFYVKVTKRKTIAVIMVSTIILTIYGVGAWRPKCKYPFGGVWLYQKAGTDEIVVVTESKVDITGKRESCGTSMLVNSDPVDYGGVAWSDCQIHSISTGKDTFDTRGICYLLDANQHRVLILLLGGTNTWTDENHRVFDFFSKIYLASQDTDGDGLPDEGQEPVMVNTWTYNVERLPWFPAPT